MSSVPAHDTTAQAFSASDAAFDGLKDSLVTPEAMQMDHRDLEGHIEDLGRELLRCLYQDQLSMRAQDDTAETPVTAEGVIQTHTRNGQVRSLKTIFGPVKVARIGHTSRVGGTLFPLDAALNLPLNLHSSGVCERIATAAARGSYEQSAETLKEHGGGEVAKRQVRDIVVHAAQDFNAYYEAEAAKRAALPPNTDDLLILSVDGKGINMRREDLRDETRKKADERQHKRESRLSPGEKSGFKRMAEVAAVYELKHWKRTLEEATLDLRPVADANAQRPRPQNKRVWASIVKDMREVIDAAFEEALSRDPEKKRRWVVLVDGNKAQIAAIEAAARRINVQVDIVLDFIHASEYVWTASTCFHEGSTREQEDWVRERLGSILAGNASNVAAGIRRSATLQGLSDADRAAADRCCDYLLSKKKMMCYDVYLAAGYPIGTGVIEGACRYLVKDRMDITGARWGLAGAEAVLQLRALDKSGDLADYWKFHASAELRRNHASRYAGGEIPAIVGHGKPAERGSHLRVVK